MDFIKKNILFLLCTFFCSLSLAAIDKTSKEESPCKRLGQMADGISEDNAYTNIITDKGVCKELTIMWRFALCAQMGNSEACSKLLNDYRSGHIKPECYASKHIKGYKI